MLGFWGMEPGIPDGEWQMSHEFNIPEGGCPRRRRLRFKVTEGTLREFGITEGGCRMSSIFRADVPEGEGACFNPLCPHGLISQKRILREFNIPEGKPPP